MAERSHVAAPSPRGWHVSPAAERPVRRADDTVVVPLRLSRDGERAAEVDLVLGLVAAEQLHAALCFALGDQPAPRDAPGCRRGVQGGLR